MSKEPKSFILVIQVICSTGANANELQVIAIIDHLSLEHNVLSENLFVGTSNSSHDFCWSLPVHVQKLAQRAGLPTTVR